jgi:alkylation response protein AidB-like acyl-CoA dehydrogenase
VFYYRAREAWVTAAAQGPRPVFGRSCRAMVEGRRGGRMQIGYTAEQETLRQELRDYYARLLTPEVEAELAEANGVGPVVRRVVHQMAADGWLGIGWPTEYGGQGRSAIEQFIFFDESMRAGAPVPMLTINTVGPTIMNFGTAEQKDFFLPKILAGELHFCIGYTEANAGTDLASLTTRAVRDGDEYVINGAKVFTSLAGDADYVWLAARTDPEAPKHKGISMFAVPMDAPGVRVVPMTLLSDHNINYTFYEDVRVPATSLVGGENRGWTLITNQLNHERVTLCSPGIVDRMLADVRAWAQQTKLPDGRLVIDQPWVQEHLARVHAELEFLRLINWKVAWQATQGHLDVADASTIKVFGTEFYLRAFRLLMEVIGQAGYLKRGSPAAVVAGRLEMYARSLIILTFGGGTNEIQRDLIAIFGLGLPRSLR